MFSTYYIQTADSKVLNGFYLFLLTKRSQLRIRRRTECVRAVTSEGNKTRRRDVMIWKSTKALDISKILVSPGNCTLRCWTPPFAADHCC